MRAIAGQIISYDAADDIAEAIKDWNVDDLIAAAPSVCAIQDFAERATAQSLFLARATELKAKSLLTKIFSAYQRKEKQENLESVRRYNEAMYQGNDVPFMEVDSEGKPKPTIFNFKSIMLKKDFYANVRFNVLANYAERHITTVKNGRETVTIRRWTDADEALSKEYIEQEFGIYSDKKHYDALRILFQERSYNPVLEILQNLPKWDGVDRCEHFLTKWALADDTPYVHECSRLIFAGGIWRMMLPGCKMDDVVVLIGKQGGGKSSLIRFLALHDDYFGEIKTVEGDKATEQLAGKWICEIPELAAFTKAREVETVKAFITRQKDSYRKPYDRNVDDRPRHCIFLASTNNPNFLVDLTGNRRFYPVQTHSVGYDLFKHEDECRDYIAKCWAEALAKYNEGRMPNYADESLVEEYRKAQDNATQDDWRIGAVESYLDDKAVGDFVCIKELMDNVISPDKDHPQNPTPKDSKDLAIIISRISGWSKVNSPRRTMKYGTQRGWVKEEESSGVYETASEGRELPF